MAHEITRRVVLKSLALGAGTVTAGAALGSRRPTPFPPAVRLASGSMPSWIAGAALGTPVRYNDVTSGPHIAGDTYFADWAANGTIYITSCDTSSWTGTPHVSNLMLGRLTGAPATPSTLLGYDVNQMNGSLPGEINFGPENTYSGPENPPRTWKASGFTAVDGVLYYGVYRQRYDGSTIPWAEDVSIIKSTDGGANWTNHVGQVNTIPPVGTSSMFPGGKFGLLDFIKYGQNGAAPPTDGAQTYVYAYSPDATVGLANSQKNFVLARCARAVLSNLTAASWQYYTGGVGGDGNNAANWSSAMSAATPFWTSPAASEPATHGDLMYNAALGRYLLITFGPTGGHYWVYESGHPWGPFYKIADTDISHDMRQPTLCTKYVSSDGTKVWVLSSGWGTSNGENDYTLWTTEMDLTPATAGAEVDDQDGSIHWSSGWLSSASASGNFDNSIHWSNTTGASVSFTFTGTTIQWIGSTKYEYGYADVTIDGQHAATIDLYTASWTKQQMLFMAANLSNASHTITVSVNGTKNPSSSGYYIDLDAFLVGASRPIGQTIDDSSLSADFSGTWTSGYATGFYNSTDHWSNSTGAYLQHTFTGTSVQWIGGRNTNYGKADVSIDGKLTTTIDLYSTTYDKQRLLFLAAGLAVGSHTIKILVRGDKNPSSSGTYVDVDALIIGTY